MNRIALLLPMICLAACAFATEPKRNDEPPTIPIGLDAYRRWDRWPLQRIGCRAYMQSTCDRRGGNEGADASHFLYQLADDRNITLDLAGPGMLYFVRYNHWHGSPWHYIVDGADHVIEETSTKDPLHPAPSSLFVPQDALPTPLTWTWSDTKGADLSWVPIGFEQSFQMQYSRTHYGTGYYIFHRYDPAAALSQPIKSWDITTPPDRDALDLLRSVPGSTMQLFQDLPLIAADQRLPANATILLPTGKLGPSMIRQLAVVLPKRSAASAAKVRLRITWDERREPSVDAPLPLFFGAGTLYNRDGREFLVKSFPVAVATAGDDVVLACNFPMPFFRSARIELKNDGPAIDRVKWMIRTEALRDPANHLAYFHATYRDHPSPEKGKDLVLLDTRDVEGSRDWTGSFVGTSLIFSHEAVLNTLEGDPRFFFDDSQSPQAQGTGTEEWGGGGDYWGGRNMTLPFAGHPCGAPSAKEAKCDEDKIESAYRFLLADLFPFGRNARIQLEHGGTNESAEHYESVTYWYGLPGASLIKTDTLKIADAVSAKEHRYVSPDASEPYEIESRYELGVDHLGNREIDPSHRDSGRTTRGTSEFTLTLEPNNWGVLLRRKLDYQFANQRAEVSIAADDSDDFKPAGTWYLAGSSTCVYSNPKEELGATQHNVQTSNRRFRDDEFLITRALTRGHKTIRLRLHVIPTEIPLFPGGPTPTSAWSEIRYDAYCCVMPPMP